MTTRRWTIAVLAGALTASFAAHAEIKAGDKLQTLSNLHPDMAKRLLYTTNYQQPGLLPVCSDVTVKKISGKAMDFEYQGVTYSVQYEKHTKNAGVSFQDALSHYFGAACDKAKLGKLSKADKDGVAAGRPSIGMTKDGVLFAMGRPPVHATPNLEANYWLYWQNRFGKIGVQFDDKGKVSDIR